jgi:hypothetical protein
MEPTSIELLAPSIPAMTKNGSFALSTAVTSLLLNLMVGLNPPPSGLRLKKSFGVEQ